jgi:hypothetical protein
VGGRGGDGVLTDQGCSMIWGMLRRLEGSSTRICFIKSLQSSETRMLGGKPYSTLSMRCTAYEHPLDSQVMMH